jgi:hypothetical protein
MNMPGFTAEASLHNCGKHYQSRTCIFNNQHVVPQAKNQCVRKARRAYLRCLSIGYGHDDCFATAVDLWDFCEAIYD